MLPHPKILRLEIEKILSVFSDTVQVGTVKVRWEEIQRLKTQNSQSQLQIAVNP